MSMRRTSLLVFFVLLPVAAGAQAKPPAKQTKQPAKESPARASSGAMIVAPGLEKWGEIPTAAMAGTPSVEIGGTLRVAIIQGDAMTAGRTYTLRLSCSDGAKIAPHWHPTTENVTVIQGAAAVGMGSKWDDAALKDVPSGGFFSAAPQMRHYAQCKGETILQVHGVGPFVINFVGADETQPAKKTNGLATRGDAEARFSGGRMVGRGAAAAWRWRGAV